MKKIKIFSIFWKDTTTPNILINFNLHTISGEIDVTEFINYNFLWISEECQKWHTFWKS